MINQHVARFASVDLNALTQIVDRLNKLLKDPHPGLITWNVAVVNALSELLELTAEV